MDEKKASGNDRRREIVRECVRQALRAGQDFPRDDEDLLESGALDSMGWVDVLERIAKAAAVTVLSDPAERDAPRSISSLVAALERTPIGDEARRERPEFPRKVAVTALAGIVGWGAALASRRIEAADLEREYALAPGTLRERAGIESVTRADTGEDELSLIISAVKAALTQADADAGELDWVLTTSETFVGYPSLGSLLHSRLLARDTCGVLDIGGACVGLLHCLAVARSLVVAGMASRVLIVTADVHSRPLAAGRVPGEFGGLFGDGASAFVLGPVDAAEETPPYRLGEFQLGCVGTFAAALAVGTGASGEVTLKFEGEALARAAVGRLERVIADLELRSGVPRAQVSSFATHQPNPRLVELLARQAEVPLEKFPVVAKTCGNLGSSTCGVALSMALAEHGGKPADQRGPIFLAAVGPGMLWGGGILY